ncbi:SGNH/GDSL hydrolase family protein [Actinoallomurus bryophytorum]|uniref:Lysophospholipase L1-like esterase n=1 Tax=Actinoallomurus bryophytorum TaxID=1490222 RepID=A0A543CSW7_9ACTN|nr:SGNH/GDSL hydrolase family protein [Actinoallomurus bryophytorum]TQM00008.1 lysophospholipase L1-like esterase [Actinoallomurus bryophytorum]
MDDSVSTYSSYVALGDSFTEGLDDPDPAGGYRGWADRLAAHLAAADGDLRYANLAVRGRLLRQVVADQVPRAIELRPDLISFSAGGNDLLRPRTDPDALAEVVEDATRRLRETGADVVLFTSFDTRGVPVLRHVRGKLATYNLHVRSIADRYDCRLVDLWSMRVLLDPRAWALDRLHLSAEGHRRVALAIAEILGVPAADDWREPWPAALPVGWLSSRRSDLEWARAYFLPWIQRRLQGRSSGDEVTAKRPDLHPL